MTAPPKPRPIRKGSKWRIVNPFFGASPPEKVGNVVGVVFVSADEVDYEDSFGAIHAVTTSVFLRDFAPIEEDAKP